MDYFIIGRSHYLKGAILMIRSKIFGSHDIYSNFPFDESKVDMQGWASDHPILPWAVEVIKPELIIEVGTWKGRSAINMAKKIQELNLNSEILCIDTWLGSPEHWSQEQWRESLRLKNGKPDLYDTFIHNVISSNCQKYITPFPITSEAAYFVLKEFGIKSDFIYIDAGHEYESVSRDIRMYWSLLTENGVMILDDYIGYPGVTKAVIEFALEMGLVPIGEDGKAVLTRNKKLKIEPKIFFE